MKNSLHREMLRNLAAALMIMMVVIGLILAVLTIAAKQRGIEPPFPMPAPGEKCCGPDDEATTPAGELGSFRKDFDTGNSIAVNSPGRGFRKRLRH
ncbi:hypothetical protein [Hyphococcus sp.]|uniref:hypothetical protein n=1 Tax=Hyphococcus sp. TaxID=2038636 RepID=UPI0035C6D186